MVKPPIVWGNLSFLEEGVLTKKKKKKTSPIVYREVG
jgi:hypothetical protein